MKVPEKICCDICRKEIEYETVCPLFIWERQHYRVKLVSHIKVADTENYKPHHSKTKIAICSSCYEKMAEWIRKEMETFTIYEEGFQVMEGTGRAHYIGIGQGETFLDACKDFIAKTGYGEIKTDANGNEYACEWGCRWFPTLEEAQRSFG